MYIQLITGDDDTLRIDGKVVLEEHYIDGKDVLEVLAHYLADKGVYIEVRYEV